LQHVLIAGTVDEAACMRALLSMLPSDAYGQVLIEADAHAPLPELGAPARVTVQRVLPGEHGHGALTAAVASWVSEWMPEEPDPRRTVGVWLGAACSSTLAAQCFDLRTLTHS
jgi:hypothetical protein